MPQHVLFLRRQGALLDLREAFHIVHGADDGNRTSMLSSTTEPRYSSTPIRKLRISSSARAVWRKPANAGDSFASRTIAGVGITGRLWHATKTKSNNSESHKTAAHRGKDKTIFNAEVGKDYVGLHAHLLKRRTVLTFGLIMATVLPAIAELTGRILRGGIK